MGKDTGIQWCDSTVNPTSGCQGCELWHPTKKGPCYAGNLHERRLAKTLPALYAADFTEVRMIPGRMAKAASWSDLTGITRPDKPWLDGMPRIIFVGDLGDIFSEAVTFEFLKAELIDVAMSAKGRRHIWMALTKRPNRMTLFAKWLKGTHGIDWPVNIWPGTSITGKASLKRIDALLGVPSDRRFVSVEPLIEGVSLAPWLPTSNRQAHERAAGMGIDPAFYQFNGIDPDAIPERQDLSLIIVGGESDQPPHKARSFDLQWARDLIGECRDAGVSCLVKQLGSNPYDSFYRSGVSDQRLHLNDSHGGDESEWPSNLRIRQFPALAEATPCS